MMNPKLKPRPITSFIEDDFELIVRKSIVVQKKTNRMIQFVRVTIMIIALILVVWLVVMMDSFISHNQAQESHEQHHVSFSSPFNTSCTIYTGLFLISSKMRPIYSPISPRIISTIP